jgi:hypothetical protein
MEEDRSTSPHTAWLPSQALYWIATALVVQAIVVGDFNKSVSEALWVAALSALLVAIASTFRPPYNTLLGLAAVTTVVLVAFVVPIPHWLRATFGVMVGAIWIWMFVLSPSLRAVKRRRLKGL